MRLVHTPACRLALAALLSAASPAMAQNVDTGTPPTVPNWPIFPFGRASAVSFASLGQSFIAPGTGAVSLDAFQFWLRDNAITGSTPYYAYIFDWTQATPTSGTTGSAYLFRSAAQNFTGAPVPTPFSFLTGGVNLVGGQSYLAVLSTTEFPNAPVSLRPGAVVSTHWPNDGYTGGESYVRHGPAGLGTIANARWTWAGGTGDDLAFRARFSPSDPTTPIPEPATVALVGLGLVVVGAAARRRA